jgi:hypothetical protein
MIAALSAIAAHPMPYIASALLFLAAVARLAGGNGDGDL